MIRETSSALKSLGFNSGNMKQDDIDNGISLKEFNDHTSSFEAAAITKQSLSDYLKGKSISVSYGGQTKNIELIGDKEEIKDFEAFKDSLQKKLDKAFGSGKVTVGTVGEGQNDVYYSKRQHCKRQHCNRQQTDITDIRRLKGTPECPGYHIYPVKQDQYRKQPVGEQGQAGTGKIQYKRGIKRRIKKLYSQWCKNR